VAAPDLDVARIRAWCDERVPQRLRDEARVEIKVRGNAVTIFDCRPSWHPDDSEWSRVPVAQLRYQPSIKTWTLHCSDRNGRWHPYPAVPSAGPAQLLLEEIGSDPMALFWG
jgi:hypothetical protein